ncbi:MAG TPA: DUF5667 domain-containing protein [Candidatus Limnocylindria bacterium]|jgi:hypothetical protein
MNRLGVAGRGAWAPLDEAFAENLERSLRRLEPDAMYRRRLRGEVLNRHVAMREGLVQPPRRLREMGALGRGVLYASLAVAIAASTAGAAAAESLPGDPLYPVKLQFEEIRLQIAPPAMRADLMAMALGERLDELEELARAGRWSQIAGVAQAVAEAEERLAGALSAPGQMAVEELSKHVAVLEALVDTAPAHAQDGLQQAIQAATSPGKAQEAHEAQPSRPPEAGPPSTPGSGGQERQPPQGDQGPQKAPKPAS